MRGVVALVAVLSGCNQLFAIEQTNLVDAPPAPDAPPPPACPAIGELPQFTTELTQVPNTRSVHWYTPDGASAYAAGIKYAADQSTIVVAGPLGDVPTEQKIAPNGSMYATRLAPEGDTLFVTYGEASTGAVPTREYRLVDGAWQDTQMEFVAASPYYYSLSMPSRGPTRRFIATSYDSLTGAPVLIELEWDGTTANKVSMLETSELPYSSYDYPGISADGLRLVVIAQDGGVRPTGPSEMAEPAGGVLSPVLYADRASIDLPFSPLRVLDSVPGQVAWPHLSEDCGRLYFYALDMTWYLKLAP